MENKNIVIGLACLFAFGIIMLFLLNNFTGFVIETKEIFMPNEKILGYYKLELREGELWPADADVIITLNNKSRVLSLRKWLELSNVSYDIIYGNFYVEGKEIGGYGEGIGKIGKYEENPNINFKFRIIKEVEEEKPEIPEKPEENITNVTTENITPEIPSPENITLPENISEENVTIPTPEENVTPEESVGEIENVSEEEKEVSEIVVEEEEKPNEAVQTLSRFTNPLNFFYFLRRVGSFIGFVVYENEIEASVSYDKPFVYQLGENERAELIKGSVNVNGVSVDDSLIDFNVIDNKLIVTTKYRVEKSGFGKEFLANPYEIELSLDALELTTPAIPGDYDLDIKIEYQNQTLAREKKTISVVGVTNVTYVIRFLDKKGKVVDEIKISEEDVKEGVELKIEKRGKIVIKGQRRIEEMGIVPSINLFKKIIGLINHKKIDQASNPINHVSLEGGPEGIESISNENQNKIKIFNVQGISFVKAQVSIGEVGQVSQIVPITSTLYACNNNGVCEESENVWGCHNDCVISIAGYRGGNLTIQVGNPDQDLINKGIATEVVAFQPEALDFNVVGVKLNKLTDKPITKILRCEDWDYQNFRCNSKFIPINADFVDYGSYIILNLTSLSAYAGGSANASLGIWDTSDSQEVYVNDSITFYANYLKLVNGEWLPINDTEGQCNILISFDDTGVGADMVYNNYFGLWEYSTTASESMAGTHNFTINCTNNIGYENLSATDTYTVLVCNYTISNNVCTIVEGGCECINTALNDAQCQEVRLGFDINASGDCIYNPSGFTNKTLDCQGYGIRGSGYGYGIYIAPIRTFVGYHIPQNNIIKNCEISNFEYGIYISHWCGEWICRVPSNHTLINNRLSSNSYGIFLNGAYENNLINSIAENNDYGIYLWNSFSNNLTNNTANYNKYDGLRIDGAYLINGTLLINNVFCYNNQSNTSGYDVYDANANTGYNNTCDITYNYNDENATGCSNSCQALQPPQPINCSCSTCEECNLKLNDSSCSEVTLISDIIDYRGTCINNPENFNNKIFDCQGHVIDGVSGTAKNDGILIDGKANNTIKNCTIKEFARGIYLSYSSNITITDNQINNNMYGLYLYSSSNNNISNNIFSENDQYDIFLSSTPCTNIIENNIGSGLSKQNLIKYFNYSVNLENETLSELILCGANYSSINNITISASPNKKNNGIILLYTSYTNITNSNSSFNNIGIRLEESSNNFIANNDLSNNNEGILLMGSNNTIVENTINNNARGIEIYYLSFNPSFNNTITNNTINNNGEGILLSGVGAIGKMVQNTNIISNTISNNSYKGIYLNWAANTSIENNEILNNGHGIYSEYSDSIINNNTVCGNTQYDFYSRDWLSSYGDNNTCSNPDGWNDTGKIGCSYSCPITLACFDITSTGYFELNNDIIADKDPCININTSHVVLDCKGYRIIGNSNFNGTAIHQAGQENVTIVNCSIIGFDYGYYGEPYVSQSGLGPSINLTLSNNEFKNVSYGIYSSDQKNVKIENNYVDAFIQGISITYSHFIPENYLIINNTIEDQIKIEPFPSPEDQIKIEPQPPPPPPPTIGVLAEDVKNLTLKYNKVRNFTYGIQLVNSSSLAIEEIKYNVGCKNKEIDIVANGTAVTGINVDNNYCTRTENFNDYNTSGCKKNPMLREIYDYFDLYLDYQYLNLSHPVSIIRLSQDNLSDLTPYINVYSSLNYENWTKLEELETDIMCGGTCMPVQGCNPLTRKPAICMSEPHCTNFVYDDFGNCRCLEPVSISVNGPYASCSNQSLVDYKFYKIIAENFCDEKEVVYARHTLRLIKPSINKTGINLIPITTHLDNKTVVGIFDYETNKGVGLKDVFVPKGLPGQPSPQITAEHLTSEISSKLKNSGMNVELRYLSYWNASLQAYVGHPAQTFANVYVRDFVVEVGKPYYIDVNKNISFTLFGKLWWPVEARIEYLQPEKDRNDIILPLNTSIKNLRQLCDIGFMNQSREVKYWDAVEQKYRFYHPVWCEEASESMLVEAGKPYTTYANQTWEGIIP
jgi:parallel beta-helix repeat protein